MAKKIKNNVNIGKDNINKNNIEKEKSSTVVEKITETPKNKTTNRGKNKSVSKVNSNSIDKTNNTINKTNNNPINKSNNDAASADNKNISLEKKSTEKKKSVKEENVIVEPQKIQKKKVTVENKKEKMEKQKEIATPKSNSRISKKENTNVNLEEKVLEEKNIAQKETSKTKKTANNKNNQNNQNRKNNQKKTTNKNDNQKNVIENNLKIKKEKPEEPIIKSKSSKKIEQISEKSKPEISEKIKENTSNTKKTKQKNGTKTTQKDDKKLDQVSVSNKNSNKNNLNKQQNAQVQTPEMKVEQAEKLRQDRIREKKRQRRRNHRKNKKQKQLQQLRQLEMEIFGNNNVANSNMTNNNLENSSENKNNKINQNQANSTVNKEISKKAVNNNAVNNVTNNANANSNIINSNTSNSNFENQKYRYNANYEQKYEHHPQFRNQKDQNQVQTENQPPIPFVDLSKLQNSRKPKYSKIDLNIVPVNPIKLLSNIEKNEPFFQNFYREVERFLISEALVENGSKVVVTVSGGVDSVVMLDVLANIADKYKFSIYVAHYNHNLRGEASANDEKFVKSLAASYNIPYYWSSGKVARYAEKNGMSIEESARFLRYFFFERVSRTIKADFLATAHTVEDSTETFLLNLFRGTGLTGLSGIPSKRQFIKDVVLIRPFLTIKKQKLIEYANKRGLKWNEDETNVQDRYTRNKIRKDLIPKLEKDYSLSIVDIINRSSKLIQGADRIIHDYVRTHLPSIITNVSTDIISIKVPLFKTFDEFIRGEMLQTILMKYFRMMPPSMKIIDRILKLENSEVGAICEISKTVIAIRDRQVITIARKLVPNKVNEKIEKTGKYIIGNLTFVLKEVALSEVEYSANSKVEFLDYSLIPQVLTIRNWEHGDEFNPLGMIGKMKVSDFLSNEKIPILDKPNVLVLTTPKDEIIWICKHRINDKFKISTETNKVLKIEIKEKIK